MLGKIQNALLFLIIGLSLFLLYDIGKDAGYAPLVTEGQTETQAWQETETPAGELPGRYDCRENQKAPTLKNQGTLGTCWAVAASSVLESRLLPQESIVFSADHISAQNSYATGQDEGGAYMISTAYLTAWQGPVTEEMDPYGDGQTSERLLPVCHVQEVQMVTDRDFTSVKELIYTYGAVQSSLYMDLGGEKVRSPYYNRENASYYYDGEEEINHDMLLIGWDDDYPAENFTRKPSANGAFICQNSWGDGFGEDGIFYVSYEDSRIGSNCVAYTRIEPADNYAHIYQSDLCGWAGQMGYGKEECWFANVYTADSPQLLRAVGFYATGKHTEYEIYVVKDFQNRLSLVLPEKVQTGSFEKVGYYTVDLEKTFSVPENGSFAVMVKVRVPGSNYPAAMEYRSDDTTANVILEDGQGYVSPDGYRWTSMEEEYDGNICLKAYTDDE